MEDLQEHAEQIFVTALGLDPNELAGGFLERPLFEHLSPDVIRDEYIPPQGTNDGTGDAPGTRPYEPQFKGGDILFDRFQVVRFIARGGMGEVYEVADSQLRGVHVALKTVLSQYAADPVMQERLQREVLNAREVVHPNLCPIYDIFHWKRPEGRLTFLTMKLLAGETLSARLVRMGPLPALEASTIIKQVGAGLSAAHDAGILHRDIKAANIILDGSGEKVYACVTDFGLARAALIDSTGLTVGGIAGTPGYMAPELFYGGIPSKASDVFSFGVVIFQILTGKLPSLPSKRVKGTPAQALSTGVPSEWKRFVEACLNTSLEKRFASIPEAMKHLPAGVAVDTTSTHQLLGMSRRRMLGFSAAVVTGLAGSAILEWPDIQNIFDPLPTPRSVALMAWPLGSSQALLSTILDSISQRLARAEAYVKDLLIITPKDAPPGSPPVDSLQKSESILGANLVLTASLHQDAAQARLNLQLSDAQSQRVLRKGVVSCAIREIGSMAEKASQEAATLLRLPRREVQLSDPEELRKVSPEVLEAYGEAEQLLGEPNQAGLKQAIAKYQDALRLDSHFALGYAKLAMAYIQQYSQTNEPANLDLADKNAAAALRFNPNSAMGLLSQALVYFFLGRSEEAFVFFSRAVQADPGNPEVLNHKAWALRQKEQFAEAEKTYREILDQRPNFWPAYNDLGVLLTRQAKYEDAAKSFASAAAAASKVAMPMANLGQTYIDLGRREDARNAFTESLSRGEWFDSYMGLGDIDFEDGKYNDALKMYAGAGKLAPKFHLVQRNMGDCYAILGNSAMAKESYRRAASLLSAELATNPKNRFEWTNMAFYHAKIGDVAAAESDIKSAQPLDANDVASRFMIAQALMVLGKKKEALDLLIWCIDHGVSSAEVDLALDLKDLSKDPTYLQHLKNPKPGSKTVSG